MSDIKFTAVLSDNQLIEMRRENGTAEGKYNVVQTLILEMEPELEVHYAVI